MLSEGSGINIMTDAEIYIHIPFCVQKCLYCDFLSGNYDSDIQKRYTDALIEEIKHQSESMKDYSIRSIYFGGGTPTILPEKYIINILDTVSHYYNLKEDAEISIECNPATASFEKLSSYRKHGINRLSIGLQSANDNELKTLGRIHTFEDFLNTYDEARRAGFSNINIDIMTGIPGQTMDSLQNTLDNILKLHPEHVSAYSLIIEVGTPFFEKYGEEDRRRWEGLPVIDLPSDAEEFDLYISTQHFLRDNGYRQYEVSNYSLPGFRCIHNIGYWERVPYYGAGLGASSFIHDIRYKNISDMNTYIEKAEHHEFPLYEESEPVTKKAAMEETIFLGLRMKEGISIKKFYDDFGVSVEDVFGPVIKKFVNQGLLYISEDRLWFSERGMNVSNEILSDFLL